MAWRIFVRDAKRVLRNPVALIVTIAIAFLPGLYAWANIAANWDPYSSSANLHVAVANEDAGSYSSLTGNVNIGKQLTIPWGGSSFPVTGPGKGSLPAGIMLHS